MNACGPSQAKANLAAGPCSGHHYLLTDPRQFGILRSGPGWRGSHAIRSIETPRFHHAAPAARRLGRQSLGVIRYRPPVPVVKFFWTALSERQGGLEFSWAAKPETDAFGHEPALVARTCSPAKLLGFLKLVGTPWCNDARRCHLCPWHSQGVLAAMAWRRTSEQPRRLAICPCLRRMAGCATPTCSAGHATQRPALN
jgi:hypothetical protein